MYPKRFQVRPKAIRAVQYEGTPEDAENLAGLYINLLLDGDNLYFTGDYDDEVVYSGDWIVLDGEKAIKVVDSAVFEESYMEVV